MTFLFGWLLFCIAAAMFASYRRNRDPIGWFFIALITSPLMAFIFLLILPVKPPRSLLQLQPADDRRLWIDGSMEVQMAAAIIVVIICIAVAMYIY